MKHLRLDDPASRNLGQILQLQARHLPDTVFLLEGDRRVTFAEANRIVNSVARGLSRLGLERGDRLAFYAHSTLEIVYLALAANKLGALWVPINTDYKGEWLRETLRMSDPAILVVDQAMAAEFDKVRNDVPHRAVIALGDGGASDGTAFSALLENPTHDFDLANIGQGDLSAILWTSGTTGRSKGVMQSHNVWICNAEDGQYCYDSRPGDIVYCVLPMYNSAAWCTCILRALVHGIGCAIDQGFSVRNFWDRVRHYQATQTFTLGAMHIFLWQQPARPDDGDNPLRSVGMVPMPPELITPFCERFGIERLYQGFGQSEALTVLRRIDGPRSWKPRALGEPCDGMEVRLVDEAGIEVAPGVVGEFAIRPNRPHLIFEGYFRDEEATRAAFRDGWYLMGDLGRRDEEGDFFFIDRKKDAVRHKGRNISTMEVEAVVRQHPEVEAAAAFGIPSAELDSEHELKLDVVRKPQSRLTEAELARFINVNAPYFFVPRYIEFVEELPYTPTNKIQKYRLRERGLSARSWDRDREGYEVER